MDLKDMLEGIEDTLRTTKITRPSKKNKRSKRRVKRRGGRVKVEYCPIREEKEKKEYQLKLKKEAEKKELEAKQKAYREKSEYFNQDFKDVGNTDMSNGQYNFKKLKGHD